MNRYEIALFDNLSRSIRNKMAMEWFLKDLDLVLRKIDINHNDGELIIVAIRSHRIEVVKILLENGAIIPPTFNALHASIFSNYNSEEEIIALVDLLLQTGININVEIRKPHPLSAAISHRNIKVLRFLIDKGANCKDMLRYPVEAPIDDKIDKNIEILDIIIEHGARPMTNDYSLMKACNHRVPSLIIIEKLLNVGVDPNMHNILEGLIADILRNIRMKNIRQHNPQLEQFLQQKYKEEINVRIQIIELLLKFGLDPRINLSQENQTILDKNYPQIQELLSKNLVFWRPQYEMPMINFRLERPQVYGACTVVLLCGERLYNLAYGEVDLSQLEPLPQEIWEHIMNFLNMRDMGNFSNRGNQRYLRDIRYDNLPELGTPSPPKVEEIDNNQDQEEDNNSELGNSWSEVEEPEQLEQPEPQQSLFSKLSSKFIGKGKKGGGRKDNTNKQKIFNLVVKILNMKDEMFESNCEKLIGITIYELESLTYMMENMTKEGLHKMPLFLKVSEKISDNIKPKKKTTMKSSTKKKKKKTTMKSATKKKKTTMKSSLKKKKKKMRMKPANIKNLTFYNNPIQV